jgi:hypothetical protein
MKAVVVGGEDHAMFLYRLLLFGFASMIVIQYDIVAFSSNA